DPKVGKCALVYKTFLPERPSNPACPNTDGRIGPCVELCFSDSDCPTGKICCSNGCGHTCIRTANPACPNTEGRVGPCVQLCSSDNDCPTGEICCSNGCGCIKPNVGVGLE
uniref:WAP domain-containing protein n=1 Tax=Cyprinodon variegatus TaxID=28743 RepID=A0A3Q2D0I0_CYPVA